MANYIVAIGEFVPKGPLLASRVVDADAQISYELAINE